MNAKASFALPALLVLLAACGNAPDSRLSELRGASAEQALALANEWRGSEGLTSFVTPQAVQFQFADGQEHAAALPADQMVVSVAPYLNTTHPCATHYTSSCQGELVNVPIAVTVTDAAGRVIISDTMNTLPNGFLDLWLPRGQELTVRLQNSEGQSASGQLATFEDSPTCITTLQLR